ncbi:MAG: hypothetical protein LBU44_01735 [Mediterranea sp.]|jgi:hypothetical protein|nr:hypothetical protein [Mediterranea sp.]
MKYATFHTILLLAAMTLNIGRYQLPHLGYALFGRYIAENLCVKRNEVNNSCQGRCHLKKQIERINETDGNPAEKAQTATYEPSDYLNDAHLYALPQRIPVKTIKSFRPVVFRLPDFISRPPAPPPQSN